MSSSSLSKLITRYIRDIRQVYPDEPLFKELEQTSDPLGLLASFNLVPLDIIGDTTLANALIQLKALPKKYIGESTSSVDRAKNAIRKFRASNIKCRASNRKIRNIRPLSSDPANLVLSEASCLIEDWLTMAGQPSPNMAEIALDLRHGPGASLGCTGTSAYEKDALSRQTCTSEGLLRLHYTVISYDPVAQAAELQRVSQIGSVDIVHASKISTVPKTVDIDRTICIEPTVNMLYQLSTGRALEKVLRRIGIDTSTQPDVNRLLARYGSVSGSFGTIDLQSASDSLSLELCRRLLPKAWFEWLEFIRAKRTTIDGRTVKLEMISSMGNGFTFPLQTLIFSSIVVASYRLYGIPAYTRTNIPRFGVFGDDIIVDRRVFALVCKNLQDLGFTINRDKTFNHGGFRESCGHDWFHGFSVRPVYVATMHSKQDRYSLLNRLVRWSARTGIPLPRVCGFLQDTLGQDANLVPPWEADDSGIKVPLSYASMSSTLLRLQNKTCRRIVGGAPGSIVYRRDAVSPDRINFWFRRQGTYHQKVSVKGYPINEGALLLSILGGYVRGTSVMVRSRTTMYKSGVLGCAPGWDAPIDPAQFAGWRVSYAEWTTAAWTCLKSPS